MTAVYENVCCRSAQADAATPNSFSIFDADSLADAKAKLKANVDEAVDRKVRVFQAEGTDISFPCVRDVGHFELPLERCSSDKNCQGSM